MDKNVQQRIPRAPKAIKRLEERKNAYGIYKGVDTLKPDGRRYHRNRETYSKKLKTMITYLACAMFGCKGKATEWVDGSTVHFQQNRNADHSCVQRAEDAMFRSDLHEQIKEKNQMRRKAYAASSEKYPISASKQMFERLRITLNRWSRLISPRIPTHLSDLPSCLQLDVWVKRFRYNVLEAAQARDSMEAKEYEMKVWPVQDADGFTHVIFGCPDFINLVENGVHLFLDGTFQTVPRIKGAYQLVTVMVEKFGKGYPIMLALMGRKTQAAYMSVFECITKVAATLNPEVVISDFELGLMNSAEIIFMSPKIQGCWFHYVYNIQKTLKKMGIEQISAKSRILRLFIQDILNLPLLPEKYIENMYNILKQELLQRIHVIRICDTDVPLITVISPFIEYFEKFWLRTVTPRRFCVYGSHFRTNNSLERFHRDLHDHFGTRPTIMSFLDNIVQIMRTTHIKFLAAEGNGILRTKLTREAQVFNERLQELNGRLTPYLQNNEETLETILLKLKEFLTNLRSSSDDIHSAWSQIVDKENLMDEKPTEGTLNDADVEALSFKERFITSEIGNMWKCKHCLKRYRMLKPFKNHLIRMHNVDICLDCCNEFKGTHTCKATWPTNQANQSMDMWECSTCDVKFSSPIDMEIHKVQDHNMVPCRMCANMYANREDAMKCCPVNSTINLRDELLEPIVTIPVNEDMEEGGENKEDSIQHLALGKVLIVDSKVQCPECPMKYARQHYLSHHMFEKHKLFMCRHCLKFYSAAEKTECCKYKKEENSSQDEEFAVEVGRRRKKSTECPKCGAFCRNRLERETHNIEKHGFIECTKCIEVHEPSKCPQESMQGIEEETVSSFFPMVNSTHCEAWGQETNVNVTVTKVKPVTENLPTLKKPRLLKERGNVSQPYPSAGLKVHNLKSVQNILAEEKKNVVQPLQVGAAPVSLGTAPVSLGTTPMSLASKHVNEEDIDQHEAVPSFPQWYQPTVAKQTPESVNMQELKLKAVRKKSIKSTQPYLPAMLKSRKAQPGHTLLEKKVSNVNQTLQFGTLTPVFQDGNVGSQENEVQLVILAPGA